MTILLWEMRSAGLLAGVPKKIKARFAQVL
jgi:hypothetical protein